MKNRNVTILVLLLITVTPLFAQETRTLSNGMVFNTKTITLIDEGKISSGTLAQDWSDTQTGISVSWGSTVFFYESTKAFSMLTLAKDWAIPGTSFIAKGGTIVAFHENGEIEFFTLSKDWVQPETTITIKKETIAYFFKGMKLQRIILLKDLPLWDNFIAAKETELHYYENGVIHAFTLAKGFVTKTGFSFVSGMLVLLDEKGKIQKIYYTPDTDTPYGQNGPLLKKGKSAIWDGNGRLIEAVFADNWTDPATGTVYVKDKTHTFH